MTVKIFVTGDLHIPSRAKALHPAFQAILEEENWDYIVLTGDNTIFEVVEFFEKYVSDPKRVIACRGNMDQFMLPLKPTFEVNGLKLGAFHGTDISPRGDIKQLKQIAKEMDVRILFTGHSHQIQIYNDKELLILNPGTGSGASGGTKWTVGMGVIVLTLDIEKKKAEVALHKATGKKTTSKSIKVFSLE